MQLESNLQQQLLGQIEAWRSRLLDIGNRNPLISSSFNPTRGVLEIESPASEEIWNNLIVAGDAGSRSMQFPWKRDLIPPPEHDLEDESEEQDEAEGSEEAGESENEITLTEALEGKEKKKLEKDWNPSIAECLKSRNYGSTDLLTGIGDRALDRRLRTLNGHAELSISEQGVHCLFLAFGFIKWYESKDSDKEIRSPLILIPASLVREFTDSPWELVEAEDDVVDNLCLRQRLKQDFGLELPPLPELNMLEEDGARLRFLNDVREAIQGYERWEVEDRCCLGRFAFPKIAMWQDLGDHISSISGNAICQSIGGRQDLDPQQVFGDVSTVPQGQSLDDDMAPGEIKAILNCDSSQLEAIVAARRGISFVLDGPPGTGKSQTIANIIADALSEGKRVLFVSEKVSALEVVKRRLDDCGLGDFCLECHSSKANRKAVLEELKGCLGLPVEVYPDASPKLEELRRQRDTLNEYVRELHRPQKPLGMSVYELHGNLARLARLKMQGKSRNPFPEPDSVRSDTLQNWIRLLDRAPEFQSVIGRHDSHPWRGFKLTSQSLSIQDDIRFNFTTLADGVEKLSKLLSPLEEANLISAGTTVSQLGDLTDWLEECLTMPDVPKAWFVSPRDIANALIERNVEAKFVSEKKEEIAEYVDGIETKFPQEVKTLADLRPFEWLTRLTKVLPESYQDRQTWLLQYSASLFRFMGMLESLEESLKQLVSELRLPLKTEVSIGSIPKLIASAQLISQHAPLLPGWFITGKTTILVVISKLALEEIDKAEQLADSVHERIDSEKLRMFGIEIAEPELLQSSWDFVKANLNIESPDQLEMQPAMLRTAAERLNTMLAAMSAVSSCLQLKSNFALTLSNVDGLLNAMPELLDTCVYHGEWVDPDLRQGLLSSIDTVILDLTEATEIRKELEERLSHRAFLPASRYITQRGMKFTSWWSKLVGGFAKFKLDVSDLYKGKVPDDATILSDMRKLNTFGKRAKEAENVFSEHKDLLLTGQNPSDVASWVNCKKSLVAFEAFLAKAPMVTSFIEPKFVQFSREQIDSLSSRLSAQAASFQSSSPSEFEEKLLSSNKSTDEIRRLISELELAVNRCLAAYQNASKNYSVPQEFSVIAADLTVAKGYRNHLRTLLQLFEKHRSDLPSINEPTSRELWNRTISGAETAEKLVKTFGSSPVLRDVVCAPSKFDAHKISTMVAKTESAFELVNKEWTELSGDMELTQPGQQVVEAKRRVASELRQCVSDAAIELERLGTLFGKLVNVLRPGMAVPLERLNADSRIAEEVRISQKIVNDYEAILRRHGIENDFALTEKETIAAEWLLKASDKLLQSPLPRAIATDAETRDRVAGIIPRVREQLEGIREQQKYFEEAFDPSKPMSTGVAPNSIPIRKLPTMLRDLASTSAMAEEWVAFSRWRQEMSEAGLNMAVDEMLRLAYQPSEATEAVTARFYQQLFDKYVSSNQGLDRFDGVRHEQVREKFRQLDAWEIKASATQVRQYQLGKSDRPSTGWNAPSTSELGILIRETEKKRRHMPLRKLFDAVPGVLQRLKPCIMMSPLSVSTFLQCEALRFDLIVFDEASQVFPWDAIGAIYRGTQLIVAGDDKQLPPTSFFTRADVETEDQENDIADFESILTLCKSVNMPSKRLRWHYRSRREPLIAFSNKHFYDGDLVTFPSVRDAANDAVRLEFVEAGRWVDRKNLMEAQRVAELVIEHHRTRPSTSLGVIAFNATQQQAIEDAIYDRRRTSHEIDALFQTENRESLFVKNLENVQGDERDVILLSFAYAKNDAGRFIKNFGPLSKPGGERRLNVAVTRAREEVVLVASVRSSDMDLSGSTSQGAHLLKAYLAYAEMGVDVLGQTISEVGGKCESPFEEEVAAALIRHGLAPVAQVGCGGFRIDLALKHPEHPGRYCLGIECDGATYHSSRTARDRDRIRQSILEDLGWKICRIWSTDWVRNPELQLQRVLAEYQQSLSTPQGDDLVLASDDEIEFDDLQPDFVTQSETIARPYSKIEDVPIEVIAGTSTEVLARFGTVDWSELITLISREFGFARAGKKIRERVEFVLRDQMRKKKISRSGERVSLK